MRYFAFMLRWKSWFSLASPFLCLALCTDSALARNISDSPLILPVRVCLFSFEAEPALSATYSAADIARLFEEVNETWRPAGVRWEVASIERRKVGRSDFSGIEKDEKPRDLRARLRTIAPPIAEPRQWQVCLMRRFPIAASGLYIAEVGTVFFGEFNKHGERRPVVLAHELGHSLNLRHVSDPSNLMYGKMDKDPSLTTQLNSEQIAIVKLQASLGPFLRHQDTEGSLVADKSGRKHLIANRLRHFDRDGDGRIGEGEIPDQARRAFMRIDINDDGYLDPPELSAFENSPAGM